MLGHFIFVSSKLQTHVTLALTPTTVQCQVRWWKYWFSDWCWIQPSLPISDTSSQPPKSPPLLGSRLQQLDLFPNFFLILLPCILDWMLFIFLLSKAYSLWRLFKKTFFLSGIILVFESFLMSAYHVYHIHMLPKHECMCMLTYKWMRTALVLIWLISQSIMTFTDIRVVTNSKISFSLVAE